jgi:hypothetical protein
VSINGLLQEQDVNFLHIGKTPRITFLGTPWPGSTITIRYYRGKNSILVNRFGKHLNVTDENFIYDGSTLSFMTVNPIDSIVNISVNGLIDFENTGYSIGANNTFTLLDTPIVGSNICIKYLY